MALSIHVPRINNNDDKVKIVQLNVEIGSYIKTGQVIAQFETDKAIIDLEAANKGYVIAVYGELDAIVNVGDIFIWLGETIDEVIPKIKAIDDTANDNRNTTSPTAKARALLREYGLKAEEIPSSGPRLGITDVQKYIDTRGYKPKSTSGLHFSANTTQLPEVAGEMKALKSEEQGMLTTVSWHRDVAVPGYIELTYDVSVWEEYANAFGQRHGLLLNPLLPLMAWHLVELVDEVPKLNATILDNQRFEYSQTNLGFTVQTGDILYLTVVRNAQKFDELQFVNKMVELQRGAAAHTLSANELHGATISFTSMSRWKVARHIPILPPCTAIIIAHTVNNDGQGVLGATYDHRVLNGGNVVTVLRKMTKPKASK